MQGQGGEGEGEVAEGPPCESGRALSLGQVHIPAQGCLTLPRGPEKP